MERPGGPFGPRDADGRGPAAKRAGIGDGQVQVHQLEGRAGESFGGPPGQVVDGPKRQRALDGQVAVLELGPLLVRPLIPPFLQGGLLDPEGQRAPAD